MNKQRTAVFTTIVFAVLLAAGCAAKKPTTAGQPAVPVTTWEQVNLTNAEIAIANDGVAQGLIAANNLGALEDEYTAQVTAVQFQVAAWQKQLTPLLKNKTTAQSNSARIKSLTNNIGNATKSLLQSGNAGVKNPQSAAQLTQAVNSLQITASNLITLLVQTGVIKN